MPSPPFLIPRHHADGGWRTIEERLLSEAESLGALLGTLTDCVSPVLLDEAHWPPILAAAERWPVTCGALAFGFEFHLLDPRPRADFGLTLVPCGRTADWIKRQAEAGTAPPFMSRLAGLLDEMGIEGGPLNREIDRAMLEIDIASAPSGTPKGPGVFLYFRERAAGERPEVKVVLAALNAAVGWADDSDEHRLAERVQRAVPPGARLISLGAFPSRGRGLRLTALGFRKGAELADFLRAVGWCGPYDALADIIARLEKSGAFERLGVMLHGCGDVLDTRLGLYLRQRPSALTALREGLGGEGCLESKLSGLRATATSPVALWGKTGEFTLLRGINHVKLVLSEAGLEQVKAYVGLVFA